MVVDEYDTKHNPDPISRDVVPERIQLYNAQIDIRDVSYPKSNSVRTLF